MKTDCTIVVSSCDGYSDLWVPFFKLLKIQWPDRPYPIVLNTETKDFSFEDLNIKVPHFPNAQEMTWGERFIRVLESIDTEYILFMLEDYFLQEPVNQPMIEQCLEWMDEDPNIACFYLIEGRKDACPKSEKYIGFDKRQQKVVYKLSAQASVWRREQLIKYTSVEDQTAWEWEKEGTQRCLEYTEDFYIITKGEEPAFKYYSEIRRGKWIRKVKVFEEKGIEVDYSERGFAPPGSK